MFSMPNKLHISPVNQAALSKAQTLLLDMTLDEKLGQLNQRSGEGASISPHLRSSIQSGQVSSIINEVHTPTLNELQRIAVEESRLGIPLLIGRDVIHGFTTVFPIPLGQAATWCERTIEAGARIAALEAASQGVNWTFAPMIDITRDPRWGRIAESLGEDPYLCARLGAAMIKGFQTDSLGNTGAIAACAKHFAGYGYSESGRDYSFANISENELRNTVLPPFKMAAELGVATFMPSFSDLNGVPPSANKWLMQEVLRDEWQYQGFIVSDWASIKDLYVHGISENDEHSALLAATAGIDMEMVTDCYANHLPTLLANNSVAQAQIDSMVTRILQLKFALGLFDNPYTHSEKFAPLANAEYLKAAKDAATKSCVLLKNQNAILPLNLDKVANIALIGPLADDGYEQLGTWIFDGDEQYSVTCFSALKDKVNDSKTIDTKIHYAKGLATSRAMSDEGFDEAISAAKRSDVAILVMGEESILSGEAHCRSNIDLPGAQTELIDKIVDTGTPVILVIMAGRPLTISNIVDKVDAVLYAWHPGTMGGPAIADLLCGQANPSGKLPVTFVRVLGQIPLYYAQKNSGRPATEASFVHQNDIPERAAQTSLGMAANHLDTHFTPLFPFGFGLSYADLSYGDVELSQQTLSKSSTIEASVTITNNSEYDAQEIVQLYIRDVVASSTRPVKELKGFKRLPIKANSSIRVTFEITSELLGFYGQQNTFVIEAGKFHVWLAPHSATETFNTIELL
jgi:beta-glucosidase